MAACLVLAGCIGAMAQGAPAKEHRARADEEANAADPDAQLLTVSAMEANESWSENGAGQDEWSENVSTYEDRIGDGGAPFWAYTYRLPNATLEIVVDEEGDVVDKERSEDVDRDEPAIEDWQISSIEAVDIVQDNEEKWTVDDEGMAFYHLERDDETSDPVWSMAEFVEDHGLVWARVNATNGEFLGSGTFDFSFDWSWNMGSNGSWGGGWGSGSSDSGSDDGPSQDGGSFQGSLSVTDPSAEHSFEISQRDHPELGVELTLDDPATSTVTATVENPAGEELGTVEASADDPASESWWDEPTVGEYTITVELQEGASQDYTINWCAEGESYEGSDSPYGPDEIDMCDYVDGERDGGPALLHPAT